MSLAKEQVGGERNLRTRLLVRAGSSQALLFLLPSLFLITLIVFIPMIKYGVLLSFQHYTLSFAEPNTWVGLENYEYWLFGAGSSLLLFSVKMTLIYNLVVVPFDLLVALIVAMAMNETMPARPVFRGLMLAGYATPPIAAGLIFAIMEQGREFGTVYQMMNFLFDIPDIGAIQGSTPWAFWGVVIAKVWRDFGFMYILLLAGLQSIPSALYEMAEVDGAGPLQRFRYITIPHLRTVILTVVLIRTINTVGNMDVVWGLTQGGPGNYTTFISVLLYKRAFREFILGQAAALGILFAAVLIPLVVLWLRTETEDFK